MSFTVVMNGPVARAGSILFLLRIKGINVPNIAANIITLRREILTVMLNAKLNPKIIVTNNIIIEHIIPFNKPTPNSLINLFDMLLDCKLLFAKP